MADAADGPWNDYKVETSPATSGNPWDDYKAPLPEWDAGSEAMNAAMLGGGPTVNGAIAALTGGDYAATKQANEAAHQAYAAANPKMSLAANLVGGLVPAAAATAAGAPAVLAGGVMGAMPGVFNQDPTQTVTGGALGAGGGAAASLLGRGAMAAGRAVGLVPPAAATEAAIPTAKEAIDLGGQQFDALRGTGATFPPGDVRAASAGLGRDWDARGVTDLPSQAPTAHGLNARLANLAPNPAPNPMQAMTGVAPPAAQPVSITDLDAMRKAFGNVRASGSTSMTDASASRQGANAILDLFAHHGQPAAGAAPRSATTVTINGQTHNIVNGQLAPPAGPNIAELSANARGNTAAGMQAQELEDYAENAANGAQNTGVGMNVGNKFRQAAGAAIKSDDFDHTPDVRAALQATNDGTPFQNLARRTGTLLGGGGGPLSLIAPALAAGAAGAAGHEAAGLPGLLAGILPLAVGHVAKSIDNGMAKTAFQGAINTALKRSPAYADNVANFVPPATGGLGSVFGGALAPAIGAAAANPGLGSLFGGN